VAQAATVALYVLVTATVVLGAVIVFGRALRRAGDRRRTRLAAPARRLLLALAAGDDEPENLSALVGLAPAAWRAVEPTAVALLGKVRGEAHTALVTVFEQRGMGERALRDVRAARAIRRARAAEVLGNLARRDAVAPLVALLADKDPDVRAVAARALGRIAAPDAAGPLLDSLAGRRTVPPQTVAHAVMRMGAGAQDALAAALDHEAELVRATAAEVLGLVGAITAANRIAVALREDGSLQVRERAAAALGRLGTRSALSPLLAVAAAGSAPTLRAVAARALGDLGAPSAAPALGALLSDAEHDVAHAAAYALLRLGAIGHRTLEQAMTGSTGRAAGYAGEALAMAEVEERRRGGGAPPAARPEPPAPEPGGPRPTELTSIGG
jgi:HEAT repeats